jgi:hypothetical protein
MSNKDFLEIIWNDFGLVWMFWSSKLSVSFKLYSSMLKKHSKNIGFSTSCLFKTIVELEQLFKNGEYGFVDSKPPTKRTEPLAVVRCDGCTVYAKLCMHTSSTPYYYNTINTMQNMNVREVRNTVPHWLVKLPFFPDPHTLPCLAGSRFWWPRHENRGCKWLGKCPCQTALVEKHPLLLKVVAMPNSMNMRPASCPFLVKRPTSTVLTSRWSLFFGSMLNLP